MFKKGKVSSAAAAAISGGMVMACMPAFAQVAQRVEITGSSIKRIQVEGATPIQTVTRVQIEKLGVANVGELINSLPSMAGAEDGGFSLQPTLSGFQGAAMPGFSNADTLVLLNGRRLTKYPVGGTDVDLNGIPLSIIERVEILRDGASAIYGSDAVAGVINLITRREFSGFGVQATYGQSSRGDGTKQRIALSAGFGDLNADRYNVMLGVEADKIGKILNADRDITRTADLRSFGLSDDRLPTSPEPNVYFFDRDLYQPISPCKAPLPAEGVEVASAQPGKVCAFDPNAITQLQPQVESTSFFGAGTLLLPGEMQLRAEIFAKKKKSGNYLNPQPITNVVSAADPANPYGEDVIWLFRSTDPRLYRQKNVEVESNRVLLELSGAAGRYDWSVDAGQGVSKYTETGSGYFVNSKFVAAIGSGVINPFTGKLNPDDLVPLTAAPVRTAKTTASFANAKVSGPVFKLPAGDMLFAAGIGYAKEDYVNRPDPLQTAGALRGDPRLASVDAGRNSTGVFGEITAPLGSGFEVGAAIRHDRYSDFGNTTNPKISLRFQPVKQLLLRGSVGKGFRAPSLEDLYATDVSGFPQAIDFAGCAASVPPVTNCTPKQIFTLTTSNPGLAPEKSTSYTLGIVFEPIPSVSASIDYIQIKKKDAIEALSIQAILDNPNLTIAGFPGTLKDLVRRLPNGQLVPDSTVPVIRAPTANLAAIETKMVDFSLRWELPLSGLKLKLENNTGVLLSRKKSQIPGQPLEEYKSLAGFPEWRNVFSANVASGSFDATAYLRSISSFKDTDEPTALTSTTRTVPGWTTVDMNVGYSGFIGKSSRIDFTVKNVLDKMPPLSEALNTSNKIDFNHSAVGRYFQVTLRTDF